MERSPDDEPSSAASRVKRWLAARGVSQEAMARAEQRRQLHLLVADQITISDEARYSSAEMIELTGIAADQLEELWTCFGFPQVALRDGAFTQTDVDAFRDLVRLCSALGINRAETAALARVIGSATSRIAQAGLSSASVANADVDPEVRAERLLANADDTLPGVARMLEYGWLRHYQAAARRALVAECPPTAAGRVEQLTVGFADLSGFTALSQQLTPAALEELIRRFSSVTQRVVNQGDGRVVKMIGDEVMFVTDRPAASVQIALDLVHEVRADDVLSSVKVGIAVGPALGREGDYFGGAVNTASRIVGITRPGAVVVTAELRELVRSVVGIRWEDLHPCYLRGIGWVRLWAATDSRSPQHSDPKHVAARFVEVIEDFTRESLERFATLRGPVG